MRPCDRKDSRAARWQALSLLHPGDNHSLSGYAQKTGQWKAILPGLYLGASVQSFAQRRQQRPVPAKEQECLPIVSRGLQQRTARNAGAGKSSRSATSRASTCCSSVPVTGTGAVCGRTFFDPNHSNPGKPNRSSARAYDLKAPWQWLLPKHRDGDCTASSVSVAADLASAVGRAARRPRLARTSLSCENGELAGNVARER